MIPTRGNPWKACKNRKQKLSYWNHSMPTLLTVNQFSANHQAFTLGGLRALIFNEHTNGLAQSGAIVRIGRKVLIDESKFFAWVQAQNKAA